MFHSRADLICIIMTQTIISVAVWAFVTISRTILNSVSTCFDEKEQNFDYLFKSTSKCYYGNIVSLTVLRALYTNQREKLEYM